MHVDSVVPWDTALARFRVGLAEPAGLSGGASSRDALVHAFVDGLERVDTNTLAHLTVNRAEFAYLYYPTVPEAHPPYDLSPSVMWFMLQGASRTGLRRVLEERRGAGEYLGYTCPEAPSRHGGNAVWGPCLVRWLQAPGDTVVERLFGPIVEREGVYKFLSFANKL